MKSIKIWNLLLILLLLQGCASPVKHLTGNDRQSFEEANDMVVVSYDTATPFILWAAIKPYIRSAPWPDDLREKYLESTDPEIGPLPPATVLLPLHGVTKPNAIISNDLAQAFKQKTRISNIKVIQEPLASPEDSDYSHHRNRFKSTYLLEIEPLRGTSAWGFTADFFDLKKYKFNFITDARIIRQSDSAMIWKGQCFITGQHDESLVVYLDDLATPPNPKVKTAAEDGIKKCADLLVNQYLGESKVMLK